MTPIKREEPAVQEKIPARSSLPVVAVVKSPIRPPQSLSSGAPSVSLPPVKGSSSPLNVKLPVSKPTARKTSPIIVPKTPDPPSPEVKHAPSLSSSDSTSSLTGMPFANAVAAMPPFPPRATNPNKCTAYIVAMIGWLRANDALSKTSKTEMCKQLQKELPLLAKAFEQRPPWTEAYRQTGTAVVRGAARASYLKPLAAKPSK
jgi:hypothetical protein